LALQWRRLEGFFACDWPRSPDTFPSGVELIDSPRKEEINNKAKPGVSGSAKLAK
jgi:hypothetical protein